jgi:hypothetical protein
MHKPYEYQLVAKTDRISNKTFLTKTLKNLTKKWAYLTKNGAYLTILPSPAATIFFKLKMLVNVGIYWHFHPKNCQL